MEHTMPSEILAALYRGETEAAARAAGARAALDLFEAAGLGRVERVAELLDADPAAAAAWSDDGFTALHLAAYLGEAEVVAVLLARGAAPDLASRNPMAV